MSSEIERFVGERLQYQPKDKSLFELAFTHSSVGRDSYERLEFLGDRVLGMVIARALYELEVEQEIPEELYEAVAVVLQWVYSMAEERMEAV